MKRNFHLLVLILIGALMYSCAPGSLFGKRTEPVKTARKEIKPQMPAPKPEPLRESPLSKPGPVLKEAREKVLKGGYEEALDVYRSAMARGGKEISRNPYLEILEWVRDGADRAYEEKDYAQAGHAYGLLSLNYPEAARLSFNQAYLAAKISFCSKTLTEEGLAEYREGNLEKALLKWKSALRFDPGNEEARKASETASIQLKNLKKPLTP